MTQHEELQALLTLSAAGLLDAAEERRVREHLRECGECAARAEEFAGLSEGVSTLPVPTLPLGLVARTQARVAAELAAEEDRRRGAILAALSALFAWMLAAGSCYFYQALTGESLWGWLAWWVIPASLAVPPSAALLARRRRLERGF